MTSLVVLLALVAPQKQPNPAFTIIDFCDNMTHHKHEEAALLVLGIEERKAKMTGFLSDATEKFDAMPRIPMEIVASDFTTVRQTKTDVTLRYWLRASFRGTWLKPRQDVTRLVLKDGAWLIVPDSGEPKLTSQVAYFASELRRAYDPSRATRCLAQAKQLAIGVQMFLADHDGVFAVTPATVKEKITPYLKGKDAGLFHCPGESGTGDSYTFNPSLMGKNLVTMKNPHSLVLLFESANGKFTARHDGKGAVAFVDNSTRLMTSTEFAKVRLAPNR